MGYKRPSKINSVKPLIGKFILSSSDVILDAGCGYGLRSIDISEKIGSQIVSVDLSLSCLKSLNSKKDKNNIDIIQADVQSLPLQDKLFDKVISGDVLEHVPNVSDTLKEFYRMLKKKGMVFLLVPSSVSEKLFLKLDNKHAQSIGHIRTFESAQFLGLVNEAGFCVVSNYKVEFFRAFYHLFQVLLGSKIEHQTGRVVQDSSGLTIMSKISRVFFYSWLGDIIEEFGKFIFPNSFVVIAVKT